jgi:hypothetical protein
MLLHPVRAIEELLKAHSESLATLHGCLDHAAAETFARWEDRFPDAKKMDQSVLAGCVRQTLVELLKQHRSAQMSDIAIDQRLNCGIHLHLKSGTRLRVRKRPMSLISGEPISTGEVPETLFGEAFPPYELAVLWTLDFGAKTLGRATLAAATSLDEPHLAAVYHDAALPAPSQTSGKRNNETGGVDDDFDDFFDSGEASGPTPA